MLEYFRLIESIKKLEHFFEQMFFDLSYFKSMYYVGKKRRRPNLGISLSGGRDFNRTLNTSINLF